MSSISAISFTLVKRTIPLCSVSKTSTSTSTPPLLLSLKNPIFPTRPQILVHARLSDSPNEYPTRSPPEFSPPVPGFDRPSVPPEVPGISTSPEVDIPTTTPPEVSPYPPPLDPGPNPGPDFPVPPLKPPPVPDVPRPFPDNPIPGPDRLPPQPPDIVPPPPPGPEIIPPPAPPPPPTGPGGPIVV
ncbi:protein TRACHEARY ELEMENT DIFFERENTIATION-RELATED 7A-like [Rosa rugosa]|uniref:protein TRACHEARY ELEMENT DIFFERENTIATION-RELATED 7A-like n=1 Tax=Rosa rugosa TaxID=74645 RepID=UPI002B40206B|nr:protein TRACHEARY ELEMENT DIFFERENTIATION-RELATED 7A-like [Rosa rugosa]